MGCPNNDPLKVGLDMEGFFIDDIFNPEIECCPISSFETVPEISSPCEQSILFLNSTSPDGSKQGASTLIRKDTLGYVDTGDGDGDQCSTDPSSCEPPPSGTTPPDPGTSVDTTPPVVTLVMSRPTFAVGSSGVKSAFNPAVTAANTKNKGKRVARGSSFQVTLSEAAEIKVRIVKRDRGLKLSTKPGRKKRCVRASKKAQRRLVGPLKKRYSGTSLKNKAKKRLRRAKCLIKRKKGSIQWDGVEGANKKEFSGRIEGKRLSPGLYIAEARAVDAAGNVSVTKRKIFRIASAKHGQKK